MRLENHRMLRERIGREVAVEVVLVAKIDRVVEVEFDACPEDGWSDG